MKAITIALFLLVGMLLASSASAQTAPTVSECRSELDRLMDGMGRDNHLRSYTLMDLRSLTQEMNGCETI